MTTRTSMGTGLAILFTLLPTGLASGTQWNYPPTVSLAQIRQRIARAPTGHPRLLATAAELASLRRSADADPLRKALAAAIVGQARRLERLAPITHTLQGKRLLAQSRNCVARVMTLATAYHLTHDERFVRRCKKEMLAAARFRDWNPKHFLDVAEMACGLAIGYDWLFDQLDATSRREIRRALVRKAIRLPFETGHNGWVNSRHNWGQVCHGGLTTAALAVLEDEPDWAARTVDSAVHHVTHSMRAYAPRGGYPEGPDYWAYGTTYNVLLLGVLDSALGTDFGLSKAPGFSQTGQFIPEVCGPSGLFFNYSDGGAGRAPQPAMYWLAARFRRPDWLLGERDLLRARLSKLGAPDARFNAGCYAPLILLWMKDTSDHATVRMPRSWSSEGTTPITVHRTSWTDPNATFIGLKGGSPTTNHGQMDIGSFVLDAAGVRWAVDLGAEGYYRIESRGMGLWDRKQDSDRWRIFRQSNFGHNTLVIDGQLQRAAGSGRFIAFSDAADFPHSILDMTAVYAGQAESVHRGVALLRSGETLIQDELTGLKSGSRIRWGMITPAKPDPPHRSTVTLRQRGAWLKLTAVAPSQCTWHQVDTAKPRHEWDSPNPGTCMLAFDAVAPADGKLTLAVLATPSCCVRPQSDQFRLTPLERWGVASPAHPRPRRCSHTSSRVSVVCRRSPNWVLR